MELIPLRFSDFFANKYCASVCARGHFYWLHLHARCQFGIIEDGGGYSDSLTERQSPSSCPPGSTFAMPSASVLHAAVMVRMHARTVVQFMHQLCAQKRAKREQLKGGGDGGGIGGVECSGESEKENTGPPGLAGRGGSKATRRVTAASPKRTIPWVDSNMSGRFHRSCARVSLLPMSASERGGFCCIHRGLMYSTLRRSGDNAVPKIG